MKITIEVELDVDYTVAPASAGRKENGFNIEPDTDAELEITAVEMNGTWVKDALKPWQIEMIQARVAEELMEEVDV